MDRRLRMLVESILRDCKKKPLYENIFTELFNDQEETKSYSKIADEIKEYQELELITSSDRDDVINYFIEKFRLIEIVTQIYEITMAYINGRNGDIPYDTGYWNNNHIYKDLASYLAGELKPQFDFNNDDEMLTINGNGNVVYLDCRLYGINKRIGINFMYVPMGRALNGLSVDTGGVNIKGPDKSLGTLLCNWTAVGGDSRTGLRKATIGKAIAEYNELQNLRNNIVDFVHNLVEGTFNVDRICEELFCEAKEYKVVKKDIERQSNIFKYRFNRAELHKKLNGFDLITTPDKMVARLAATFLCADYYNDVKNVELKIDDSIIIRLFTNDSFLGNTEFDCLSLLTRCRKEMKDKSHIHLKDVIATYLKYKDDPTILRLCREYCK